jgi:hypothetical protein
MNAVCSEDTRGLLLVVSDDDTSDRRLQLGDRVFDLLVEMDRAPSRARP